MMTFTCLLFTFLCLLFEEERYFLLKILLIIYLHFNDVISLEDGFKLNFPGRKEEHIR